MIHVVVGILTNEQKQIFIAQRSLHQHGAGLWEFPGGKVEQNEPVLQALVREFQEEIGIQIHSAEPWFQAQHAYEDRVVLLDIWLIKKFTGNPYGAEGQLTRWVQGKELNQYQFPEGNRIILERLINLSNKIKF